MDSISGASAPVQVERCSPCIASLESIGKMEKDELHLHLGGAWPTSFLQDVAEGRDFAGLQDFIAKMEQGLEYSAVFEVFKLVAKIIDTNEKVQKGAHALCGWLASDNVYYAEVRTAVKCLDKDIESYLLAVLNGLQEGQLQYSVKTPLLLSLKRADNLEHALNTVELAKKYRERGICGIDISGESTKGDLKNLIPAIELTKEYQLPIVLHLGESEKEDPERQIWELETLQPRRIGHGVHLSPAAIEFIRQHRIPLEVCLKSSELAQMVPDAAEHPGLKLHKEGHPVCVCTDDPSLFSISLSSELYRLAQLLNLTTDEVKQLLNNTKEMRLTSM